MAKFRVRTTDWQGTEVDNDFEWQSDADECFFGSQHDDHQKVEQFNVWSTGTEDLVAEWHNQE